MFSKVKNILKKPYWYLYTLIMILFVIEILFQFRIISKNDSLQIFSNNLLFLTLALNGFIIGKVLVRPLLSKKQLISLFSFTIVFILISLLKFNANIYIFSLSSKSLDSLNSYSFSYQDYKKLKDSNATIENKQLGTRIFANDVFRMSDWNITLPVLDKNGLYQPFVPTAKEIEDKIYEQQVRKLIKTRLGEHIEASVLLITSFGTTFSLSLLLFSLLNFLRKKRNR